MNALFRPGPLAYIPNFIARKHGREAVVYDLPAMQEYLEETYGITVYQEQVMLLSQKLAGFTKGEADTLRKAMGKKQKDVLDKMKGKFMEGCAANGHDPKVCEKVWTDWEAFASYAFNKSHSTCYAFVAFQTGYLKAHYPAEYMSSVLTHNLSQLDKVTFFMEECRRMGLTVLGPDINESDYNFSVNKSGKIRFGLGAVKGVGEQAVIALIDERKENGPFTSVFDVTKRVSGRFMNRRCIESLAYAGALDCFEQVHRAQYFTPDSRDGMSGIEKAVRFGLASASQAGSLQQSLFGDLPVEEVTQPMIAACEPWSKLEALSKEKDVIGFYISGHPLDDFRFEIKNFCSHQIDQLIQPDALRNMRGKDVAFAGIITQSDSRVTKTGKPFGSMTVEDLSGKLEIALFGEDYGKLKQYMESGSLVYIRARIQSRFRSETDFEVKPYAMGYLTDLGDRLNKDLVVTIRLRDLNPEIGDQLRSILEAHPGSTPVRIQVFDEEKKWLLPFRQKQLKVKAHTTLIDEMARLSSISVSLV
jgi:DNA polymerase-3 subunit alpha